MTSRVTRTAVGVLIVVLGLAGCTAAGYPADADLRVVDGTDSSPGAVGLPARDPFPVLPVEAGTGVPSEVTPRSLLADSGADAWPVGIAGVDLADLPMAPPGFSGQEVERAGTWLRAWFEGAFLNEAVMHHDVTGTAALDLAGAELPADFADDFRAFDEHGDGLALTAQFPVGTTLAAPPRVRSSWGAYTGEGPGVTMLGLSLNTRTVYVVTDGTSATVIPVSREMILWAFPRYATVPPPPEAREGGRPSWELTMTIRGGIDSCRTLASDRIVPDYDMSPQAHEKLMGTVRTADPNVREPDVENPEC